MEYFELFDRNVSSLNTFMSSLPVDLVNAVPIKKNQYYSLGSRSVKYILSRIRTKISQLKNDLFQNGISLQNKCTCGLSETHTIISSNVEITPYIEIDL